MNNLKNPNCFEKAEAGGRKKIKIMDLTDKLSNEVQTKPILLLTTVLVWFTQTNPPDRGGYVNLSTRISNNK